MVLVNCVHFINSTRSGDLVASASTNVEDNVLHWTPDMRIVIDDDNQIKIEPMSAVEKRRLDESVSASAVGASPALPSSPSPPPQEENISGNNLQNHNFDSSSSFNEDLDDLQHQNFESKRLNTTTSSTPLSTPSQPYTESNHSFTKIPFSSWRPLISSSAQPLSPYSRRKTHPSSFIPPSSSKIPDYVAEQLMESNRKTVHADDDGELQSPNHLIHNHHYHQPIITKSNSPAPSRYLEVPIGSSMHTIRFQNYDDDKSAISTSSDAEPTSSSNSGSDSIVNQYENNHIIELPSSKPVLPIVFNFRTSSSPIVTTQTHLKGSVAAVPSAPKTVQYFRTVIPPQVKPPQEHYTRVFETPTEHNKPYSSNSFLPYRMYHVQSQPQRQQQLYSYGGKPRYVETKSLAPVYKQQPTSINYPNFYTTNGGSGVDYTDDYYNGLAGDFNGYSHDVLGNGGAGNYYHHQSAPSDDTGFTIYDSLASSPRGYAQMMHKNPYMDIGYTIPYRIEDLYKKPLSIEEPQYLSTNKFNRYH